MCVCVCRGPVARPFRVGFKRPTTTCRYRTAAIYEDKYALHLIVAYFPPPPPPPQLSIRHTSRNDIPLPRPAYSQTLRSSTYVGPQRPLSALTIYIWKTYRTLQRYEITAPSLLLSHSLSLSLILTLTLSFSLSFLFLFPSTSLLPI